MSTPNLGMPGVVLPPNPEVMPARVPDVEVERAIPADSIEFRNALERYSNTGATQLSVHPGNHKTSLGDQILSRATHMATELKKSEHYISKLLEQASRTGDQEHLLKAMMALNDYETRIQFVSKLAAKASSAVDQLSRLQ